MKVVNCIFGGDRRHLDCKPFVVLNDVADKIKERVNKLNSKYSPQRVVNTKYLYKKFNTVI